MTVEFVESVPGAVRLASLEELETIVAQLQTKPETWARIAVATTRRGSFARLHEFGCEIATRNVGQSETETIKRGERAGEPAPLFDVYARYLGRAPEKRTRTRKAKKSEKAA